jgi:mediator of RNA polymerase II transcription subunit 16
MDLICWLADSLFCLLDDSKFQKLLTAQTFSEMTPYLFAKNEVALHMVLSSSIRGLLSAVCRRMIHLHSISQRAILFYERNGSEPNIQSGSKGGAPPLSLRQAYQKMMRCTSTSLIDVQKFDELLTTLGTDIRKKYSESFAELGKRMANEAAKQQQQNPNAAKTNAGEDAIKRAQTHCELTMLLAGSPPSPFFLVVEKFFKEDLTKFRTHCNPAKLFFADYNILEVDDESKALTARRQRGVRVDLFKRDEIFCNKVTGDQEALPWRRCVRCASVMEDASVTATMPGIVFLLSQQRNCCCGGRLAILPKGELIG